MSLPNWNEFTSAAQDALKGFDTLDFDGLALQAAIQKSQDKLEEQIAELLYNPPELPLNSFGVGFQNFAAELQQRYLRKHEYEIIRLRSIQTGLKQLAHDLQMVENLDTAQAAGFKKGK
ncbi:hypothetical protein [Corynebacterium caspium]|uniref:hypothetical protein n=1 Tax=Corynebacterium caspium TaxID=234828 RepID=UPI0003666C27|nr:hypothetical protein [Corynebacterium caspium]WKD59802.1 hypothetical protein CCASP_07115 [Corynebacterium caspium DSM 44850]